jgi:O-methyltransferase
VKLPSPIESLFRGLAEYAESWRQARRLVAMDRMATVEQRYDARFEFLSRTAAGWGFVLYNRHLMWQDDPEFWHVWSASPYSGEQRADRKFVLWSLARNTRHLPGDTAECGVYNGASTYLICAARRACRGTTHHAFDSFEGLSAPSQEDRPASPSVPRWKAGDLRATEETARARLGCFDNIRFHRGWIPSRFADVAQQSFSFVHIDVDLYRPTKESLEFFYPRLVPGGVLLCDDYGSHMCAGARRAFDEYVAEREEQSVVHVPTGQGFIVKRSASGTDG